MREEKAVLDSANGLKVFGFHKSIRTSLQATGTFLNSSWRWSACSLVSRKEMAEDATWRSSRSSSLAEESRQQQTLGFVKRFITDT
jgi:hypothetical protein